MLTTKLYNSDADYQSIAGALCLRVGKEQDVKTGGVKDACIPDGCEHQTSAFFMESII